jgi:hypothetical protein
MEELVAEFLDRYTKEVLEGDERKAREMVNLFPSELGDVKELAQLVKELSLIYRLMKPSPRLQEKLFSFIKPKPSLFQSFAYWASRHKRELAIGATLVGSACSLAGLMAYLIKFRKAAA